MSGGANVGTTQHTKTINIATYISRDFELAGKLNESYKPPSEYLKENITIVGHSLGGGLASIASIVSGLPAMTFNAAGVTQALCSNVFGAVSESWGIDDSRLITVQNRITAWNTGVQNIRRVTTEWDILTQFQNYITIAPTAIGLPYKIDLKSQYDEIITKKSLLGFGSSPADEFLAALELLQQQITAGGINVFKSAGATLILYFKAGDFGEAHSMNQIIFGLLDQDGFPNLFGYTI